MTFVSVWVDEVSYERYSQYYIYVYRIHPKIWEDRAVLYMYIHSYVKKPYL